MGAGRKGKVIFDSKGEGVGRSGHAAPNLVKTYHATSLLLDDRILLE
jgi:hypothetical protein